MKRTLSIILVVIMLASLMPAAFAGNSDAEITFVKANSIENGKKYLIVATQTAATENGGSTDYALANDSNNKLPVTPSGNVITLSSTDAENAVWEAAAIDDDATKFKFSNSDVYIARKTQENTVEFISSPACDNTHIVMIYNDGTLENIASNGSSFFLSYEKENFTFSQNKPSNIALYVERTLKGIAITTPPTKTAYIVGESFNPSGMVIKAEYSDKTESVISNNDCTFVPSGALAIGVTDIKVNYQGKEAKQPITVSATKVELNKPSFELEAGKTEILTATTTPPGITIQSWETNSDAVTLDRNGNLCSVTAVKAGTATVTVTDSNDNKATCTVTVKEPASSIKLDKEELTLEPGGSYKLKATTVPADTTIEWTVDDAGKGSVEVASDGTVTAKAVTSNPVTVTATTKEKETASCQVEVVPDSTQSVVVTDPTTEAFSLGSVGEYARFQARVTPAWTTENNNDIHWTSSNDKIAKVIATEPHGTGAYIQASGVGSTIITASCGGQSAAVTVYVVSDYKFTAPTGKLIWYYDRNPQYNLEFSTTIANPVKVTVQAGNKEYDFSNVVIKGANGAAAIPYSALYGTFGRQTTTMTVKVFYGPGANDYIYKNLYYRSVYDAPLTADTDMTWAYITLLISGLFITASPFVLKKKHQN